MLFCSPIVLDEVIWNCWIVYANLAITWNYLTVVFNSLQKCFLILQKVEKLKKAKVKRETEEEIDLLDTMLSSLVETVGREGHHNTRGI